MQEKCIYSEEYQELKQKILQVEKNCQEKINSLAAIVNNLYQKDREETFKQEQLRLEIKKINIKLASISNFLSRANEEA